MWDTSRMSDSAGKRVATYRSRRGLSQAPLAGLLGRSESWLSQVERGVRSVDRMSVLLDLSRLLNVEVQALTGTPWQLVLNGGPRAQGLGEVRSVLTRYGNLAEDDAPAPTATSLRAVASDLLGVPIMTIYHWRRTGYGPRGTRVGRYVRCRESEIERWLDEQVEKVGLPCLAHRCRSAPMATFTPSSSRTARSAPSRTSGITTA